MSDITEVITRFSYIAEDEGLKRSSNLILEQTKQIEALTKERVQLAEAQAKLTAKDIEQQKKISQQITQIDAQIKAKTKTVINERVANADLNKELVKELGYLGNLQQKLEALKNQRAFATSAKEVKALTQQIDLLDKEMKSALSTAGGAGRIGEFFKSVGAGLGIGVGTLGVEAAVRGIVSFMGDAITEIEEAEKAAKRLDLALTATGRQADFPGIIKEANQLAEAFQNVYDNDEIVAAQTELVKYGKFTREELSGLTRTAIELASSLGTDVPTAANKIVDILAGRGAATLRDFGISTKEATTDQGRLALVLNELQGKLKGTTEAYAQTAAGIRKQNEVMVANTKEQIGEKLLPIYLDALRGINDLLSGEWDKIGMTMLKGAERAVGFVSPIFKDLKNIFTDVFDYFNSPEVKAGASDDIRKFYADAYARAQEAQRLSAEKFNKGLTLEEIEAEKQRQKELEAERKAAAEKAAAQRKAEEEKRKAEQAKIDADYLAAQKQIADEAAKLNMSAMDYELMKLNEHFEKLREAYRKKGADIAEIETLAGRKAQEVRDRYALEEYKKEVERETNRRKAAKEAAKKAEPVTGEFLPGTTGDVSTIQPSALDTQGFIDDQNAKATAVEDSNKRIAESFQDVNDVIQTAGQAISNVYSQAIDSLNKEADAQQGRIERAKKYAERGGAELLQIEEDRLDKINQKREEFAQQQLIINNALALSNAVLAVATTAGETGVGAIAAVPAVLAVIAAGYALATSLTEPQYLAEGTKEVKGPGTETSDSVPAMLSKGERVMAARRSKQFRSVLDDIQDGKFRSEADMFYQIRTGGYGPSTLNYNAILGSAATSKSDTLTPRLLGEINTTLQEVRETIADKPVASLIADENGLNLYYGKVQRLAAKRSKY